jgi:hypothetical protein
MNLQTKIDNIFNMEKKYSLFDMKTENIPVWDIIRYYALYSYITDVSFPPPKGNLRKPLKCYIALIKILLYSGFCLLFKKRPYILFGFSRNMDQNGMMYDVVCDDIITELQDQILIVEKKKTLKKYRYKIEYNFVDLVKRIIPAKNLPVELYRQIDTILKNELKIEGMSYNKANSLFRMQQKEYNYYRAYFTWKKPQKVFVVGFQKGLVAAAHSLQIPVFELQHGSIDYSHITYSYPGIISRNDSRIFMPDYLLTFADYWGTDTNIPSKTYSIGNNNFAPETGQNHIKDASILFISGFDLSQIAIQYAQEYPEIIVKYKLHPNQYSGYKMYEKMFRNHKNIHILTNEFPMSALIAQATLVVLIASTVLYEALSWGAKVAIYKAANYESQSACFSLKNVYLFDTAKELHQAYLANKQPSEVCFFEKFNREKFRQICPQNTDSRLNKRIFNYGKK